MRNKLVLAATAACLVLMNACTKEHPMDNIPTTTPTNTVTAPNTSTGAIELGQKLNNPYSVENMQKAYNILEGNGQLKKRLASPISATHLYVRFLPKDGVELETLKSDSRIFIYDYPLDYEIETNGSYYHDPSLAESAITWQYTVVPVGFQMPDIEHETLAELFLENETETRSASAISEDLYTQIEKAAFKLTGNEYSSASGKENQTRKKSKWNPDGTIKVYDDVLKVWKPIVGVKVRARNWFKTREATTNSSGYFRTASFKNQVNYSIKWECGNYFDLRRGSYGQAYFHGPKMKGSWNPSFPKTHFAWAYGHAFRAAQIYYTNNEKWNIKKPPYNRGLLKQRLHIAIKDKDSKHAPHYFDFNKFWQAAQVVLYYPYANGYPRSERIFATTIHEVAHASHWEIANQNMNWLTYSGKVLVESWAEGIETQITRSYYPGYHNQHYRIVFTNSILGKKLVNEYTPIVDDLIDDFDQSRYVYDYSNPCPYGGTKKMIGTVYDKDCYACEIGQAPNSTQAFVWPDAQGSFYHTSLAENECPSPAHYDGANCFYAPIVEQAHGFTIGNKFYLDTKKGSNPYPVDHVKGYTLQQLELALKNADTMKEWKENIKNLYNNSTEKYVDELFGSYNF